MMIDSNRGQLGSSNIVVAKRVTQDYHHHLRWSPFEGCEAATKNNHHHLRWSPFEGCSKGNRKNRKNESA